MVKLPDISVIVEACDRGRLSLMQAYRNFLVPSHCLYADDILIFFKATLSNFKHLTKLFEDYGAYSGKIINVTKSKFYTGAVPLSKQITVANLTGFKHGSLPFAYFGILLFKGRSKAHHFRPIVDRIKVKLAVWKGLLLSIMGRVQLVNSVINSMLQLCWSLITSDEQWTEM
jgi:hypothetical protein